MISIYLIQNIENGKVYVGKTSKTLERRWELHLKKVRGPYFNHFYNAIRKYGTGMFKIRQIDAVETEAEANQRETYWITQIFHSNRPENGYNQTEGGEGTIGLHPSEETRQKLSSSLIGNKNAVGNKNRLGKFHSEETKLKISLSLTGRKSLPRKPISEETRQRMSVAHIGKKYAPRRPSANSIV
jgi:group I intron endonuclease